MRKYSNLELKVADARNTELEPIFDYSICMNNTLGNIEDKDLVVGELRRVIKSKGLIIAGLYSENSIDARIEWYERTGLQIQLVAEDHIQTFEGFKSWHFSGDKIHELFGDCLIFNIGLVGYFVIFQKQGKLDIS